MIAKNNEEKRNKIWRMMITGSSILIIVIAAFFVIKLFTANPLEGRWSHDDSSLVLTIKGGGQATLEWPEEFEGNGVSLSMEYQVEKDTKTLMLRTDEEAIQKAAEQSDGAVTAEGLRSAVNTLERTYDYSIDKKELTLTDREYGDQMVFDKK